MPSSMSKLVLGSANFGLSYGIANRSGQLGTKELIEILNLARASGINYIDTAQAYGNSELRLGLFHETNFEIITKIGVGLDRTYCENKIRSLVCESLDRLELSRLSAVLLHRPELLIGSDGPTIALELNRLKEQGLVEKIGVSIYSPEILTEITKLVNLDIVQAPFNLFDQRILKSGWSEKLKNMGTEIHTRSIFLQGLLLMQQSELPKYFLKKWKKSFADWYEFQINTGFDADEIALDFGLRQSWIDKVVVGVDDALQLSKLLQIESNERLSLSPSLNVEDTDLIDPSRWRIS